MNTHDETAEREDSLSERITSEMPLLLHIWGALRKPVLAVGIEDALPATMPQFAYAEIRTDAYDGSESLYGEWRSPLGSIVGSVIIHASGNVFAEYDVIQVHPRKPRWFIEATTAWGKPETLQGELRLLPSVEN